MMRLPTTTPPVSMTLRLQYFDDVPIMPYTRLLGGGSPHEGGPVWPDWERQTTARHCRKGQPCDHPPIILPIEDILAEPVAWAGPIVPHFGHQLAEFSLRILPTLAEWPDAVFAFAANPPRKITSLATAPGFFREILAWFGVAPERTRVLVKPTLAARLRVAPQAEQLGRIGPAPDYLDLLDTLTRKRLGRPGRRGRLYVSRAGQSARFAGERYLETALAAAGVAVFRPERVALAQQLRRYAVAEHVIFAEGSALHGTQLLGRALGRVSVLCRRPSSRLAEVFVQARAQSLEYLDCGAQLIYGLDATGRIADSRALTVLDEALLLDRLEWLGIPLRRYWDSAQYQAACADDIREWLVSFAQSPRLAVPGSRERILACLAACGFAALAPAIDAPTPPIR
ncbi:glycosyltransferase 61 family protein [Methylomagnum ishizawai]|nr:glycosyltransferase 61 family protein [Methylomagnum ishizawai]